ncbi:M48 family metalloprotease, partial [Acinetobacter baumannii]
EREADAHALKTLKAAGISTAGFAAFFRRVAKISGETTDQKSKSDAGEIAIDMLRTHPSTKERIAAVEAQPPYPSTPALSAA